MRQTVFCTAVVLGVLSALGCDHATTAPRLDQLALDVVSGNGQTGVVGTPLAPLIVKVTSAGNPVAMQVLNFRVVSGGGSVYGGTELTDDHGIAQEIWTLGTNASQSQKVEVRAVESTSGAEKIFATFTANAVADQPESLMIAAGDSQTVVAGAAVSTPPIVKVTDRYGNPIAGVTVSFAVASGAGTAAGQTQSTNALGLAAVGSWTLGPTAGLNTLSATTPNLNLGGSPATIIAFGTVGGAARLLLSSGNNQSGTPGAALPLDPTVQVVDVNGNGVAGVAITFTVTNGGGLIEGVGSVTTLTAQGGTASVSWTLGNVAGTNSLQATAVGLNGSPVTFSATGTAPQAWTQLSPAPDPVNGTPSPRIWNSTVYNTATKRLIIFGGGGSGGFGILNDVWVLTNADGTGGSPAWIKLNPIGGPPGAREAHIAVYDQANNRMIIHGGYVDPGQCGGVVSDAWVLSNADGTGGTPTWTELLPMGTAPARRFHGAAYDAVNNRLIINGGAPSGCGTGGNDTWVLTNANGVGGTPAWIQLTPSAPTDFPGDASDGNTGYDPGTNTLIRFLVNGSGTISTWLLANGNGLGGAPAWSELAVSGGPVVSNWIAGGVLLGGTYDPVGRKFAYFGGPSGPGEIWTLAGANGTGTPSWARLSPGGTQPDARTFAFLGYESASDQLTMFGGSKDGQVGTDEVWVLTGALH